MPSRIKIKRLEWYHSTCYLRGAPAKIEPWLPLPVLVAYLRSLFLPRHKRVLEAVALRDNGLNLSLGEQHRFPLSDVFRLSFPPSKLCAYRSREGGAGFTAFHRAPGRRSRAGLAPVSRREKVPPRVQRMRADDLLAAVFT